MDLTRLYIIIFQVESAIYIPVYISFGIIILKSAQHRQNKTNQLLLNLSLGYLIVGVSSAFGSKSDKFILISASGFLHSNIAVFMLCIDRCACIVWPLRYLSLPRAFHIALMCCTPIISGLTLTFISVKSNEMLQNDCFCYHYYMHGVDCEFRRFSYTEKPNKTFTSTDE